MICDLMFPSHSFINSYLSHACSDVAKAPIEHPVLNLLSVTAPTTLLSHFQSYYGKLLLNDCRLL